MALTIESESVPSSLRHSHHYSALWAAIAAGSAARKGGAPVSAVDLKGCHGMGDQDVVALLAALPELRCGFIERACRDARKMREPAPVCGIAVDCLVGGHTMYLCCV